MTPCWYCGASADTIDHALPQMVAGETTRKVHACRECNVHAGATLFTTMGEKAKYIRAKLVKRYATLLRTPVWTEDDLDELAPSLRMHIEASLLVLEQLHVRLRILRARETCSDPTYTRTARPRRVRA